MRHHRDYHANICSTWTNRCLHRWSCPHRYWTRSRIDSWLYLHWRTFASRDPWKDHVFLADVLLRWLLHRILDLLRHLQEPSETRRVGLEDGSYFPDDGAHPHPLPGLLHPRVTPLVCSEEPQLREGSPLASPRPCHRAGCRG